MMSVATPCRMLNSSQEGVISSNKNSNVNFNANSYLKWSVCPEHLISNLIITLADCVYLKIFAHKTLSNATIILLEVTY